MLFTKPKRLCSLLTHGTVVLLSVSCLITASALELPITVNGPTFSHNQNLITTQLPVGVTPYYLPLLNTIYRANSMQSMWEDKRAIKAFEQQLAEVALAGFQPQFAKWVELLTKPDINGMARDIILSDAFLGYLHYINGVESKSLRAIWLYGKTPYYMDNPNTDTIQQWQTAVSHNNVVEFVHSLAPVQEPYQAMRLAMLSMLNDAQEWPQIAGKSTLRLGNNTTAENINALKEIISRHAAWDGYDTTVDDNTTTTVYTGNLVNEVKKFQLQHGLVDDGIIGQQTRDWLNTTPQQRAALLALNIQRLRLIPAKIGTHIMVNIPDYSLTYYIDGQAILGSRVIVGRYNRKTPIMDNTLTNVVVNPPWNVPTKLAREDIMPKLQQDPDYLQRLGIKVYSDWNRGSEPIDPSMIDWANVSPKNSKFRFQQLPGRDNALGRYKFNMPNSEAIYLHDTPNHRLFERNVRALSSGCVRVNKASELAAMLLSDAGWDQQRVSGVLQNGKTTHISLRTKIPVQLYYMTAWFDNDQGVQFREDIYKYDVAAKNGLSMLSQIRSLLS